MRVTARCGFDLNGSGTGIQNGASTSIQSGYTSGASYTLDHTAPAAPSSPDLTSADRHRPLEQRQHHQQHPRRYSGTAESGSTVTLYDTDGTTVLGTRTATGGDLVDHQRNTW